MSVFIGTAGWNIPKDFTPNFNQEGSHLHRYGQTFNLVEINSSFYREHQAKSYSRWNSEVPEDFKFCVKLAKAFTHECGLRPKVRDVQTSLERILHLENKLGVILVQLPGSLEFKYKDAERFYKIIRKKYSGPLVLEPRNSGWISKDAQKLMQDYGLSKVIADPERCPGGIIGDFTYYRLHGWPIIYRSSYTEEFLKELAIKMKLLRDAWCVFDNTTFGMATQNALDLKRLTTKG